MGLLDAYQYNQATGCPFNCVGFEWDHESKQDVCLQEVCLYPELVQENRMKSKRRMNELNLIIYRQLRGLDR